MREPGLKALQPEQFHMFAHKVAMIIAHHQQILELQNLCTDHTSRHKKSKKSELLPCTSVLTMFHSLSPFLASACRFPGRARALADSIQAWHDMQEENAQAFRNKLDATFIQKIQHIPQPASVLTNDSRKDSSESLKALSASESSGKPLARTSSSKRAVLVAR